MFPPLFVSPPLCKGSAPHRGAFRCTKSLPLPREVDSPQAKTEGEKNYPSVSLTLASSPDKGSLFHLETKFLYCLRDTAFVATTGHIFRCRLDFRGGIFHCDGNACHLEHCKVVAAVSKGHNIFHAAA